MRAVSERTHEPGVDEARRGLEGEDGLAETKRVTPLVGAALAAAAATFLVLFSLLAQRAGREALPGAAPEISVPDEGDDSQVTLPPPDREQGPLDGLLDNGRDRPSPPLFTIPLRSGEVVAGAPGLPPDLRRQLVLGGDLPLRQLNQSSPLSSP